MTMSVSSFFQFYMFYPEKASTMRDSIIAMISTIALGVFSFGLAHLFCYVRYSTLLFDKKVIHKEEHTEEEEKVNSIFDQAIHSTNNTPPDLILSFDTLEISLTPHPQSFVSEGDEEETESGLQNVDMALASEQTQVDNAMRPHILEKSLTHEPEALSVWKLASEALSVAVVSPKIIEEGTKPLIEKQKVVDLQPVTSTTADTSKVFPKTEVNPEVLEKTLEIFEALIDTSEKQTDIQKTLLSSPSDIALDQVKEILEEVTELPIALANPVIQVLNFSKNKPLDSVLDEASDTTFVVTTIIDKGSANVVPEGQVTVKQDNLERAVMSSAPAVVEQETPKLSKGPYFSHSLQKIREEAEKGRDPEYQYTFG